MSLIPNTSAFSRPIALAMRLQKSFVLKTKHIQLILAYTLIHFSAIKIKTLSNGLEY